MAFEPDEIRKLVTLYLDRAKSQKRQSEIVVIILVIVLGLALGVFFYAPKITGFVSPPAPSISNDNTVLVEYYQYVGRNEFSRMTAVLAVRISVTIMLLFIIQILWSSYRYYARLAAFYSARADCLLLIISHLHRDDGLPSVDDLIRLFSPTFDFGKATSPTETTVDVARMLLDASKSKLLKS
jgi:hypothetical protein